MFTDVLYDVIIQATFQAYIIGTVFLYVRFQPVADPHRQPLRV